jgi:hypothetical protein
VIDLLGLAERLLRRHERRRPEHEPGARGLGHARVAETRDAEVEDLERAARRAKQVLRLDVAVDDPLVRGGCEHVKQRVRHLHHLAVGQLAVRSPLLVGLPFEELDHQEGRPVLGDLVIEHARGVRVVQLVGGVSFEEEAAARLAVERDLAVQDLDRDAIAVAVGGQVDGRHAPDPEQLLEPVLLGKDVAYARFGFPYDGIGVIDHAWALPAGATFGESQRRLDAPYQTWLGRIHW